MSRPVSRWAVLVALVSLAVIQLCAWASLAFVITLFIKGL